MTDRPAKEEVMPDYEKLREAAIANLKDAATKPNAARYLRGAVAEIIEHLLFQERLRDSASRPVEPAKVRKMRPFCVDCGEDEPLCKCDSASRTEGEKPQPESGGGKVFYSGDEVMKHYVKGYRPTCPHCGMNMDEDSDSKGHDKAAGMATGESGCQPPDGAASGESASARPPQSIPAAPFSDAEVRELGDAIGIAYWKGSMRSAKNAEYRAAEAALRWFRSRPAPAANPPGEWNELRPEVQVFAQAMEAQLRANDHKPGWKRDNAGALWDRLLKEVKELEVECLDRAPHHDAANVLKEAADVANFAMMIVDVCGGLVAKRPAASATGEKK